jgi:ubiquinone/menaquinone biosynthesis C-methylase UbiE
MTFNSEQRVRKGGHLGGLFAHADRYDRMSERKMRGVDARIVADVVAAGLGPADRLLDAGTGPGRLPRAIAAALPDLAIDGVDVSPQMIEYAARIAKNAARITFTVGDVADLPYPDGTFALIVSSISQHHWADVDGGVRELHRVLRPGGQLWIYDSRFLMRRVSAAARAVFPAGSVHRETIRTSRLPVRLISRLAARA